MSEARAATAQAGTGRLWQWMKHHLVATASTVVDYAVMVCLVELAHLRPVPATALSAIAGALASFSLNRIFTYHVRDASIAGQSWRYALVSGASLGWNAAGEYLFSNVLGLQYLLARIITSIIVSNAWNYPLQRFFVFSRRRAREQVAPP